MTPLGRAVRSRFSGKFHCPECDGRVAYRSRPRSFFERRVLPAMLLQAVRCERCYLRVYVSRMIPVLEPFQPGRMSQNAVLQNAVLQNAPAAGSRPTSSVA